MKGEIPVVLSKFLTHQETIAGHSSKTVDEYYLDLRTFFRFLKKEKEDLSLSFEKISIQDIDINFLKAVTLNDVYSFMRYLSRERAKHWKSEYSEIGIESAGRARKIACIRSFYKFLTKNYGLEENPMVDLESPKQRKTLPQYLSLRESILLLSAVEGKQAIRDYAILTLFLNCGLRRGELAGLDIADIGEETIRVRGKGGKDRIVFQNDACRAALEDWLEERPKENIDPSAENALFLSGKSNTGKHGRMAPTTIHTLVKKHILNAGLDPARYSAHKLRHTAATLMLQNGVDVRTLQEVLGHEHLNTTQIYTHVDNAELRIAAKANPLGDVKRK